jgi:hypothetical protein
MFGLNETNVWLEYGILERKTSMFADSEEISENYWSFQ